MKPKTKKTNSPIINPFDESNIKPKKHWKVKTTILSVLVITSIIGLNIFFDKFYLVSPILIQNPIRIRGSLYPIIITEPEMDKIINGAIKESVGSTNTSPVKARENEVSKEVNKKQPSGFSKNQWVGQASVYSEEGCLGCSPNLTMANGETFTNKKVIVAFNKLPLNTHVKITNLTNGLFVEAKVADRGGFEKYDRIVDLGLATAEAINCDGLCQVKVEEI